MLRDPWIELRNEMGWEEEEEERLGGEGSEANIQEPYNTVNTQQEDDVDAPIDLERESDILSFGCPRCTRHHPGPPDECRSCDKACRRCGVVGHFQEVHDVTHRAFREIIVKTIGQQLWN